MAFIFQVKGPDGTILPYDKDGNPLKPDGTPHLIGSNGQVLPLNPDGSVKVGSFEINEL